MESKQSSSSSSFVDQSVVPGAVILDLSTMANQTVKLGDGLRQDGHLISVIKAGKLRFTEPNEYWVESSQKRDIVDDEDKSGSSTSVSRLTHLYIPDDLLSVFVRDIPLPSLKRLSVWSKRFANLVTYHVFSKSRSRRAIFVMSNSKYNLIENHTEEGHSSLMLHFPLALPNQFCEYQLGGSALGLVFLRQVTPLCKEKLIILNPITQNYEYLPDPELVKPCRLTIGTGAGVIDDDVFYYRLSRYNPYQPCNDTCCLNTCGGIILEILDVANCKWSKFENIDITINMFQDVMGTFCKGKLYWLGFRDQLGRFECDSIVSFDCKEQAFSQINLDNFLRLEFCDDHLGVIEGNLCFVTIGVANLIDVIRIDGDNWYPFWSFLLPDGYIKYITMTNDGGVYLHHQHLGIVRSEHKASRFLYEDSFDSLDLKYNEDEAENISATEFDQTFHYYLRSARALGGS